MPADPSSSSELRASDADRDRVIEVLRAAGWCCAPPAGAARRRLVLRTAWCDVMLDLTRAVPSGPELVIELRVRGGNVELVLAPGMVVDANELAVRFTELAISRDAGDNTPETLRVRLIGRMRHARIDTRWLASRR